MALMKCDKSTEPILLTRKGPKIGLVINHVVPHWIKWLWRLKSFRWPVCSPSLLRRYAPGKEGEGGRGKWGKEIRKRRDSRRNLGKDQMDERRSSKVVCVCVSVCQSVCVCVVLSPGCTTPPCLEAPLCNEMRMAPCTWASRVGPQAVGEPEQDSPLAAPSSSCSLQTYIFH